MIKNCQKRADRRGIFDDLPQESAVGVLLQSVPERGVRRTDGQTDVGMGASPSLTPCGPEQAQTGRTRAAPSRDRSWEPGKGARSAGAREHRLRASPPNTEQKPTFSYISEENKKHLVPFAGVHSERKVGSTFDYHKRESYAQKATLE